jgi:dihydroxyacetone kinase
LRDERMELGFGDHDEPSTLASALRIAAMVAR